MESTSPQITGFDPIVGQPLPTEKKLLAPVWHTIALVALMMLNSYGTAALLPRSAPHAASNPHARLYLYGFTVLFELFLLFLVWIGLRLKRVTLRELIGGRWKTPEDFLLDIVIAIGFWVAALFVLGGLGYLLGLANASKVDQVRNQLSALAPQTHWDIALWIGLSIVAGFTEEIIFRGYLQRQIAAISGKFYLGLIASAIIFGAGHGYEGAPRMLLIAVFGLMFGLLAHFRKSLRPGMMAHAWHDALAGVVLRFLPK
jgi:membrane protease YdiL (CAAX protease family)